MQSSLLLLSVSFLVSFSLVPLMKKIAIRNGILDFPNERKMHQSPIPLLGGIGIYLTIYIVIGAALLLIAHWDNFPFLQGMFSSFSSQIPLIYDMLPELGAIMAGGIVVSVMGIIDDKYPDRLSYKTKFLIQFMVAGILVAAGIHTVFLPFYFLNVLITLFWIVGITNAFNLLDNMNGLSSGVALVAATIFSFVAFQHGQFFVQSFLMVFIGALLGFLPYNFPKASIFLGDSGSLLIGYILGCLTVVESYVKPQSGSHFPVILPLLVLSVPLFDVFTVLTIRFVKRVPLFKGDKRHLSHCLVKLGMSPTQAVMTLYLFTLIIGLNSLLLADTNLFGGIIIISQTILILVFFLSLLFIRED